MVEKIAGWAIGYEEGSGQLDYVLYSDYEKLVLENTRLLTSCAMAGEHADKVVKKLEAENTRLRDDAITYVRNNFESAAIEAWKQENARLRTALERIADNLLNLDDISYCVMAEEALKDETEI